MTRKNEQWPSLQRLRDLPNPDECVGLDGYFTEDFEHSNAIRKVLPRAGKPKVILGYGKAKKGQH